MFDFKKVGGGWGAPPRVKPKNTKISWNLPPGCWNLRATQFLRRTPTFISESKRVTLPRILDGKRHKFSAHPHHRIL